MAGQDLDWREQAEIDDAMVGALIAAVGPDTFAALKSQFASDLQTQADAYHQARQDGDAALAGAAAHALRGAALNIGLTRLGHLAGALERGARDDEAELNGVLKAALTKLLAHGSV